MTNTTINNAQLEELNTLVTGNEIVSYSAIKLITNGKVVDVKPYIHNAKTTQGLNKELEELSQTINAAIVTVDDTYANLPMHSEEGNRLKAEYNKVADEVLDCILNIKSRMIALNKDGDDWHEDIKSIVEIDHPNEHCQSVGIHISTVCKPSASAYAITLEDMAKADKSIAHIR